VTHDPHHDKQPNVALVPHYTRAVQRIVSLLGLRTLKAGSRKTNPAVFIVGRGSTGLGFGTSADIRSQRWCHRSA